MTENKPKNTKKNNGKRVALGLSGGVDSALSAYLLTKQGFDVTAVRFPCLNQASCQNKKDRLDAQTVAKKVGIPFKELDLPLKYQNHIVDYFINEYKQGRTPNPDVICNQIIKFGWFYDWTMSNDFDCVATGHYARIIEGEKGQKFLASSSDQEKDQTYFLHRLEENQLEHIKFPIGHLEKTQVRELAGKYGLPVAQKKDSTGLCFVCNMSVQEYLEDKLGNQPGEVVDIKGNVIGRHQGLWFYTIGQRRGFSVNKKLVKQNTNLLDESGDLPPLYVIEKRIADNQLVVGSKQAASESEFGLTDFHLINSDLDPAKLPLKAKIRHQGKIIDCQLRQAKSGWQIKLDQPAFGVSPGQFAVFYTLSENLLAKEETVGSLLCLGGGVIT